MGIAMVRRNKPKQARNWSGSCWMWEDCVAPLISPQCDDYRSMRKLHEALLNTVRDITGRKVDFIRWHATGQ